MFSWIVQSSIYIAYILNFSFVGFCMYSISTGAKRRHWAYWLQVIFKHKYTDKHTNSLSQTHTHPQMCPHKRISHHFDNLAIINKLDRLNLSEDNCGVHKGTFKVADYYETIMSFIDDAPVVAECGWNWVDFMTDSLKSRRKKDRFCVKRSRFFMSRLRSTDTIRLLNQMAIVSCFSNGCDRMIFSFKELNWECGLCNFILTLKENTFDSTWNSPRWAESIRAVVGTSTTDFCNPQTSPCSIWWRVCAAERHDALR